MKNETLNKLNSIAKIISDKILFAVSIGCFRKSPCDDEASRFESIKKTITIQKAFLQSQFGIQGLDNICKTTRQINYLANEVLYRLRTNGFFKNTIPTQKYVQSTFNF